MSAEAKLAGLIVFAVLYGAVAGGVYFLGGGLVGEAGSLFWPYKLIALFGWPFAVPVSILLGVCGGVAFYVCRLKEKNTAGNPTVAGWAVFAALYAAVGASLYSVAGNYWLALFWPARFVWSGNLWGPVVVLAAFAAVALYVYALKCEDPAPAPQWQGWGTAVAVPSILTIRPIPPTWRPALFPRCPNCGEGGGQAEHMGCGKEPPDLYIDINTGHLHCIGCGHESGLERWRNHCTCGAVWDGGEIWQGMAAEVGSMGDLAWLKAAGVRRGTLETTFLGWFSCLGCGRRFDKKAEYLRTGTRKGGICPDCHDEAKKQHAAWFRKVPEACSWCGYGASASTSRVRVGHAYICRSCTEEISRMRARAGV
jgi:hypothetical protein